MMPTKKESIFKRILDGISPKSHYSHGQRKCVCNHGGIITYVWEHRRGILCAGCTYCGFKYVAATADPDMNKKRMRRQLISKLLEWKRCSE